MKQKRMKFHSVKIVFHILNVMSMYAEIVLWEEFRAENKKSFFVKFERKFSLYLFHYRKCISSDKIFKHVTLTIFLEGHKSFKSLYWGWMLNQVEMKIERKTLKS